MTQKNNQKKFEFLWEATSRTGDKLAGEMEAVSATMVRADLRRKGLTPKKVKKKSSGGLFKRKSKIVSKDITVFTRQMATMMKAGIPLVQSFDIVSKSLDNEKLSEVVGELKNEISAGKSFGETLPSFPKYFNDLYISLVSTGEASGQLDVMLDKVATYREKVETLTKKVKKALTYPIAVMVVAAIVTAALLIYVVPQFEELFKGFGADLPTPTKVVINMSKFLMSYWYIILAAIGGVVVTFTKLKEKSDKFNLMLDTYVLKIPLVGNLIKHSAVARFARTLSITFAAGLPLVDAMKSVASATGNLVYFNATHQARELISQGQTLQAAITSTRVFPNLSIQLVSIGEESGNLEEMLNKVADYYEEDVDNTVDSLSSLLEPMIMAFLGVIIGGLVIAMYMPIFKLGAVV